MVLKGAIPNFKAQFSKVKLGKDRNGARVALYKRMDLPYPADERAEVGAVGGIEFISIPIGRLTGKEGVEHARIHRRRRIEHAVAIEHHLGLDQLLRFIVPRPIRFGIQVLKQPCVNRREQGGVKHKATLFQHFDDTPAHQVGLPGPAG